MSVAYALFYTLDGAFIQYTLDEENITHDFPEGETVWEEIDIEIWNTEYNINRLLPELDIIVGVITWVPRP